MSKHSVLRSLLPLGLIALLALPIAVVMAAPQTALAQTKSFHMDRYDADIAVNQDGSLDVTETLVYVYDAGSFHRGSRNIPLNRTEGISSVQVDEDRGGQPILYQETNYDPDTPPS